VRGPKGESIDDKSDIFSQDETTYEARKETAFLNQTEVSDGFGLSLGGVGNQEMYIHTCLGR
jgi:hypothetical protein